MQKPQNSRARCLPIQRAPWHHAAVSSALYEKDFPIWAEHQAELLRRMARGERPSEPPDWPNLVVEVQGLARAELHACQIVLRRAMLNLLRLHEEHPGGAHSHASGADARAAAALRIETLQLLADAALRLAPSMRHRIDLPRLYVQALRLAYIALPDPDTRFVAPCPWTLAALLDEHADLDRLLDALA